MRDVLAKQHPRAAPRPTRRREQHSTRRIAISALGRAPTARRGRPSSTRAMAVVSSIVATAPRPRAAQAGTSRRRATPRAARPAAGRGRVHYYRCASPFPGPSIGHPHAHLGRVGATRNFVGEDARPVGARNAGRSGSEHPRSRRHLRRPASTSARENRLHARFAAREPKRPASQRAPQEPPSAKIARPTAAISRGHGARSHRSGESLQEHPAQRSWTPSRMRAERMQHRRASRIEHGHRHHHHARLG